MASFAILALCCLSHIFGSLAWLGARWSDFPGVFYWFGILTANFAHANQEHLADNIMFLFPWIFYLEFYMKEASRRVWDVFLWGGACGMFAQTYLLHDNIVGSSCGLMAILGYAAVKGLKARFIPAFVFVVMSGELATNLFDVMHAKDHIGHVGHVGGLIFGILYALLAQRASVPSEKEAR